MKRAITIAALALISILVLSACADNTEGAVAKLGQ